ncbi:MAG TPA: ABC transporter permease [Gemmatimonadaceae bacterium]
MAIHAGETSVAPVRSAPHNSPTVMESLLQDIRYALRGLRRTPGFTLVALLTLALGIGVNSAIFGIVNAVLFRPLPVERPGALVDIYGHSATSSSHDTHSYPNYLDFREQTRTLSGLIGYSNFFAHASLGGGSELVVGELVTDNYFQVLGVRPALGRTFTPEEMAGVGAAPVAVLSHGLWQSRFGGDPAIVGKTFRLNGRVYTIVGVAPESFGGMFPAVTAQMWLPVTMAEAVEPMGNQRVTGRSTGDTRLERRGQAWLWLKGRMAPGVTPAQVRAEFDAIASRLAAAYPETNAQERVTVIPSRDVRINPDLDRAIAPAGMVLIGAVSLVLLVACANLANLMLARAAGRRRELALRVALGARRVRLLRQLLTESMVIALAGGLVAVPLAAWMADVIAGFQPPLPIELGLRIAPDWRVLVFTLVTAIATGMVIGLIPALRASRPDLAPTLKEGGEWMGARKRLELRDGLVVMQMAVSLVLVVGGALLVRSLSVAGRVDHGYPVDRLAHLALAMDMTGYDAERAWRFFDEAKRRLLARPDVEAVGMASRVPLEINNNGYGIYIEGHQSSASDEPYRLNGSSVDEDYLAVLGLTILEGQGITAADREEQRRVAVVTQTMAERYWPGQPAVGREFRLRWDGEPYQIIGVVEDYKVDTPGESPKPYIHLPLQRTSAFGNYIVRTRGAAAPLVPALEREFRAIDPEVVFLTSGTMRDLADVRLYPVRAGAWLIGVFGMLALVVAAIGLYGVIGYSVSRRVKEIGIRKALGADARKVVLMVLGEGMLLVVVGGVVGGALAALGGRALSSVLFVGPFDVVSFAIAFGVLGTVAMVANAVPAWRAARVDPVIAIKSE